MSETVTLNEGEHRYEIAVDGELAGFTVFKDREQQRIFYHTEVFPKFGGRGLSSTLVTGALDDVRARGLRAVPVCPLVAGFLSKHSEYDDIADPVTGDVLVYLRKA
ncbi:GNAT family N-acetyltransferase [Tsukamurella sp. 8F]|uniref:GNAT family N-acetyltransferase n=1 Tax=unclassified Tsukamurella TaxID=2633480 RepID=UPI0023B9169A|nr:MULTISPECIES: GNAT family N-acetyltransferase [unclassified Tsukamurella]MDF0528340.1 GNAT family N-acetyltransferase [Tsukamurella sp. 8J]MDF0586165.1 GNAT family N-acetyltransferase [Tsukamurella sp. 8F]